MKNFAPERGVIDRSTFLHLPLIADEIQANADAIKRYPNPASTKITIEYSLKEYEIGKLTIYDMLGRVVKTLNLYGSTSRVVILIENFASGIYLYKYDINTENVSNGKFIKE
jgi:hypothetical protein